MVSFKQQTLLSLWFLLFAAVTIATSAEESVAVKSGDRRRRLRGGTSAQQQQTVGRDLKAVKIEFDPEASKACAEEQTFTCGDTLMYVCPSAERICSRQFEGKLEYHSLTVDQCEAMRSKQIGDSCVALPQHHVSSESAGTLMDKVCYTRDHEDGIMFDRIKTSFDGNISSGTACSVSFPNEVKLQ